MYNDRITVKEAKEKAMQWCSRREYCRKEIFEKVISWGCTPTEAQETVDFLVKHQFIDDHRYTEAYVKDKLRFNKWGKVKIAHILRAQNIDPAVIQNVLSGIDETEYKQTLTNELAKKYRTIRKGNVFETKGKLFRFAASRGFESEIINEVISKIDRSLTE